MTPSGGFEVAFHGEYREIVPNERIVNAEVHEMPGAPRLPAADEPVNLVTFTEATANTTLSRSLRRRVSSSRGTIINSGWEAGMQESMDALEEVASSLG